MRLKLLSPGEMSAEQKETYDEAISGMRGAPPAPMMAWLNSPQMAKHATRLGEQLRFNTIFPAKLSEIAILVTGAHFDAAYEIYAHIAVAEREGMSAARLSELCANIKPGDLNAQESVAYDVAFALVNGGVLPEPCYRLAVTTFGQHGANELIYLVGLYCMVSMTLNGFNVPVPERE